ncbi:MAG TPA: cell division protein FtsQ/DivIB [Thermoleophilaceae bacterium]|nr:cell division protein FtsQ/DivIB [Thermoleophilaceae bacterium]
MSPPTAQAAARRGRLRIPSLPAPPPNLGRLALGLAAACALLAGLYMAWLRDSGLVRVERVTVTGLTSADAPRLRSALTSTARTMTTLNVDRERLERAVAGYPVVRGLEVEADFPRGLAVRVIEHHPAAIALVGGSRVPVAGDGTLLRGLPVQGRLPTVRAEQGVSGEKLADRDALAATRLSGAAPDSLRERLSEVRRTRARGFVARMREGPELIFGSATRLRSKWAAAARVLADPGSRGASYIDLRLPERPAAGGVPAQTVAPVAPASAAPSPTAPGGSAAEPSAAGPPAPQAQAAHPPEEETAAGGQPGAGGPGGTAPPSTAGGAPQAPTGGAGGGATAPPAG